MTKSPDKHAAKPASNATAAAGAKSKPAKSVAPKSKAAKPAAATATIPVKTVKVTKSKAKFNTKSVIKQTSETISKLASDILADRIIPTIEQIKAVAASALGQDYTSVKKKKRERQNNVICLDLFQSLAQD